jgi:two-component system sensor histidine kinase KdpD
VTIVDEEAARLDMLIGEAVEMAEIDANVVQVHAVPQHPRALLDQAWRSRGRILAGHRVSIAVEGEDEPAWFDPHLLGRVLRHLLENAARHTPAGSRISLKQLEVGRSAGIQRGRQWAGHRRAGFAADFREVLPRQEGAHKGKGSGMGLAITRAILMAHGGESRLRARRGKGRASGSGCRWWRRSR